MTHHEDITLQVRGWDGEDHKVHLETATYSNGRLALAFWTEGEYGPEPYAKLTVNLPDEHLNEGEVFIKDWAENSWLVEDLLEAGWITKAGREVNSGYVFPLVARLAGPLADLPA